ncbi:DIS3-like exonuclease 2 [Aphelenchoides bicaudatus]|nr:DIS3-like exonuclease 2 [Aphelenchoides bicaudatus]
MIDQEESSSKTFYQPFLPIDEVRCGLESGLLVEGALRVNQKNYEEAYVSNPEGDQFPDILVLGLQDRNRAFMDDIVVVKLNDREQWTVRNSVIDSLDQLQISTAKSNTENQKRRQNYCFVSDLVNKNAEIPANQLQKTGKVVHIKEAKGSRTAVGFLKTTSDGKRNWALFSPNDSRIPRMLIPAVQLPEGFFKRPQDFGKFLFVAELFEWKENSKLAKGKLFQCLGKSGDVAAESAALLISNKIDTSRSIESSLPLVEGEPWKIDRKEFKYRKDFRDYTIFTIDPATARDLDDALHIKRIPDCDGDGNPGWEVGVHIADVSYFVKPGTEIDEWAKKRATSVYLVEKVIPMLPRVLCEELCSLNAGVDRLTFSIVWQMDEKAKIKKQWVGRSVIRSCVKMAYDHAQEMIENPEKEFNESDLPEIYNNKSISEIKESVLNLNNIGTILKKRRTENGSLRIDGAKMRFALASKNGMPVGVGSDPRKEANFLVEELMLLANMQIAKHIHNSFPDTALLRRHPPPKVKAVSELDDKLNLLGFEIEFSSGQTIADSLKNFAENELTALHVHPTLSQLVLRCMQLALYFSTGTCKNFHHYALNVPFYTHFTSPIRRYPDLIVHRLLAASLDYEAKPTHTPEELQILCMHCNDQKVRAKTVSEGSAELFFGFFIREIGHLRTVGVVINVLDSSIDVFLVKYNLVRRVYTQKLKVVKKPDYNSHSGVMRLHWEADYVVEMDKQRPPKSESATRVAVEFEYDEDTDDLDILLDKEAVDESDGEESKLDAESSAQTLKAFSPVIVLLQPVEDSAKFTCTLEPTTDDFPLEFEEIKAILNY